MHSMIAKAAITFVLLLNANLSTEANQVPDWENPAVFDVCREPPHTTMAVYPDLESALKAALAPPTAPAADRDVSPYLIRLDGSWKPLAATLDRAFAAPGNVQFAGQPWSGSFSHGEFLRAGYDQTMTVDPAKLTFLFQGVSDQDRKASKAYGQIPWRLGLLEPADGRSILGL